MPHLRRISINEELVQSLRCAIVDLTIVEMKLAKAPAEESDYAPAYAAELDVLLLNLWFPDGDGFALVGELARTGRLDDMTAIAMTAAYRSRVEAYELRVAFESVGGFLFLEKGLRALYPVRGVPLR